MKKIIYYFSGTGNSLRTARLDNIITRKLGLPEKRTRYHNPYVAASDLIKDGEKIL